MPYQNNQITAPRVDFLDQDGKIAREWYMYLYNLYTITGAGSGVTPIINGGTGLSTLPASGQLLIGSNGSYKLNLLGAGAGISVTNGAGSIVVANTGVVSITATSPVVSSGGTTPVISLASNYGDTLNPYAAKTANYVLAGPTTGASAKPTFRALVAGDIPALPYGTGTVTSVGLSLPTEFTVTNSPVTTAGTLTATWASETAKYFFAAPNAVNGTPTFRAIVASDIPALSYAPQTSGTSILYGNGAGGFSNVNIGSGVSFSTGTLSATGSGGTVTSVSGTAGRITSTGGTTPVIDLASGVAFAGTTGSSTLIPVVTIDTYGRVTSITTAANPQGTVTSVIGTSPVVSSGGATPAISLAAAYGDTLNPYGTKTANYVLAGPTTGASAAPAFRALVATDIPSLPYGTGTVTSVATAGTVSGITLTGGPITTTGTVTLGGTLSVLASNFASQTANTFLAAPNGSAGTPTFRSVLAADVPGSALTKTDDTNVTLTLGGSPTSALLNAASLTLGWSGQLGISRGGTNTSTAPSAYGVVYGNSGGTAYTSLTNGTTGQVLTANTSGAPTWVTPASGGSVTSVSVASANGFAGTVATATTTPAITLTTSITGVLKGNATAISAAVANTDYFAPSAPVTKTADFTVAATDVWLINNKSGSTCTATLPAASSWTGRVLRFLNYQIQTLVSASSNVVPLTGGAAGTSILLASSGDSTTLVSDGTNWLMTQYIPNNVLLLE